MNNKMCILCLRNCNNLFTLADTKVGNVCLQEILTLHFWEFNEEMERNVMCDECFQKVEDFHIFYLKVRSNYSKIDRQILKHDDVSEIDIKIEFGDLKNENIEPVKEEMNDNLSLSLICSESVNHDVNNEPSDEFVTSKEPSSRQKRNNSVKNLRSRKSDKKPTKKYDNSLVITKKKTGRDLLEDNLLKLAEYFSMQCDLCLTSFVSLSDAREHYQADHNRTGYLVCCERRFFKYGRIVDHLQTHENPDAFKCTTCGKNFLDGTCLKKHISNLHPAQGRDFKCDLCDMVFTKRSKCVYHMSTVHRKHEKHFECNKCGKKFGRNSSLTVHTKNVHGSGDSKICHICAKYFKSAESYDSHYKIVHSNELQKVQCDLCSVWLKHKGILRKHMQGQHETPNIPQVCKHCGKVALNARALRGHVKLHHSNRTYTCQICNKIFKKSTTLREHMAIHTGEKALYKCSFCPKTFRSSANMYAHRKRDHPLEYQQSKLSGSKYNTLPQ